MLCQVAIPLLLALGPTKPEAAKVALHGVTIDRASQPVYVIAEGKAGARILLDESTAPGLKEAAMSELVMLPGAKVPEHTHDMAAELIYILEGQATMTLDGKPSQVRA